MSNAEKGGAVGIVAEFARHKAELVNKNWAVSALTESEFVASLWEHRIKVVGKQWVYEDHLSRWSGNGNKLFRTHLERAFAERRPVRIVKATTPNIALVESGGDASKAKNTFQGTAGMDRKSIQLRRRQLHHCFRQAMTKIAYR